MRQCALAVPRAGAPQSSMHAGAPELGLGHVTVGATEWRAGRGPHDAPTAAAHGPGPRARAASEEPDASQVEAHWHGIQLQASEGNAGIS